jgi:hypothetical protein
MSVSFYTFVDDGSGVPALLDPWKTCKGHQNYKFKLLWEEMLSQARIIVLVYWKAYCK